MSEQRINRYPVLHKAIAAIIHHIQTGLVNDEAVHVGTDQYEFIKEFQSYAGVSLPWWQEHMETYSVIDCSVAVSSIWLRLSTERTNDIFGTGTYFYNSKSGSFEIEANLEG